MSGASETTTATVNDVVHPPPPRPLPGTTTNGRKRGGTSTSTSAAATVTPSSSLASLGGGSNGHGAGAGAGVDDDLSRTAHAYARAAASSVIGDGGDDDEDYDDESDVEVSSSSRRRRRRRTPQLQQDDGEVMESEEDGKLPARAKAMDTDSDGEQAVELGVRRIEVSQERERREEEDGKPYARRECGAAATMNGMHHASSSASAASTSIDDQRNARLRLSPPLQASVEEGDGKPPALAEEGVGTKNGEHHAARATMIHQRLGSIRKRAAPAFAPVVRIVSATYGPEDGRRLLNGDVVSQADRATTLPNRRDVSPVLRALLIAHDERRGRASAGESWGDVDCTSTSDGYEEEDGIGGGGGVAIMDGKSMNVVFGDPCPGTTKRLDVTYVFDPPSAVVVSPKEDGDGGGKPATKAMQRDNDDETEDDEDEKTQLCRSSFAEHERVVLRRRTTTRAGVSSSGDEEDPKSSSAASAGEDTEDRRRGSSTWRLCPGTSEIVLPIVLPYLDLRHRVLCSEVCATWRRVVSDWGVARRVDVSDPSFSKYVDARRFLRGVIKSSYGSLRSLFLNNYTQLERDDFEAAVPHLRMLRTLDVSRCRNLTDETMTLVAEHLGGTLEVLYVKGLRKVGDVGIVAVSEGCPRLRVLEISQVPVTDVGGVAIGTNLLRLEALYMRDNFKLTNRSVDVITSRCDRLEQLTLWGCTRLRGLRFEENENVGVRAGMRNVALLNLWGCHGLRDDAALGMASLRNLRILIASECHQLSDEFVVNLVQTVPHIQHLHLRYLRRITDAAVDAVATGMPDLRTLDLSFCTTVTASSLANLLDLRRRTLSELRLYSCRRVGDDGRGLLRLAGAVGRDSVLDVLDLRGCHVGGDDDRWGGPDGVGPDVVRRLTSPSAAAALGFTQPLPGFFVRPAVWNGEVRRRLVGQVDAGSFR